MKSLVMVIALLCITTYTLGQQFNLEATIEGNIDLIFDFDGDGICEYVKDTNKVYDAVTHQLKFSFPGGIYLPDELEAQNTKLKYPLIDFNNDGVIDVISSFSNYNSGTNTYLRTTLIYDLKNETVLFEFPNNLEMEYMLDLDGDDELEIVLEKYSYDDDNYTSYIYSTGITTSLNQNLVKPSLSNYKLNQNYPNPFNPSTTISFEIPQDDFVEIKIYDINGKLINTLVNEDKRRGYYEKVWHGLNDHGGKVASGTYFYQMIVGQRAYAKKMIFLK